MFDIYEQERVAKGYANHHRIRVLETLEHNKGLSLDRLVSVMGAHYKTISVHTRKLHRAGLIAKRYFNREVIHSITNRGRAVLTFYRKLE